MCDRTARMLRQHIKDALRQWQETFYKTPHATPSPEATVITEDDLCSAYSEKIFLFTQAYYMYVVSHYNNSRYKSAVQLFN